MADPVRVTLLLSCFQVSEQICRKVFVSDIFLLICNLTGKSQNFGDRTSHSATVSCKESYFLWDFVQEMIKSNYFVKLMYFISAWSHKHWSFTIIEVKYKFNQNLKSQKQSEANINLHECTYISPWLTVSIISTYLCFFLKWTNNAYILKLHSLSKYRRLTDSWKLSIIKPGLQVRSLRFWLCTIACVQFERSNNDIYIGTWF